jgi:hypothetical protein
MPWAKTWELEMQTSLWCNRLHLKLPKPGRTTSMLHPTQQIVTHKKKISSCPNLLSNEKILVPAQLCCPMKKKEPHPRK